METLGKALRLERNRAGINVVRMAQALGRSHTMIYRYESGMTLPPEDVWEAYCSLLPGLRDSSDLYEAAKPDTRRPVYLPTNDALRIRKSLGLSQREMAKKIGCHPKTIRRYELGGGIPEKSANAYAELDGK